MVFPPPAKPGVPSWKTLVQKRNEQLSSPTLKDEQPVRRTSNEEVDPREIALHDQLCPLFQKKPIIIYKPEEDDMAARMFGLADNREAARRHSEMPHVELAKEGVSGYHFDELFRD